MLKLLILMVFVVNCESKCVLPKLGMFDCGNGECVSTDLICDNKNDCPDTNRDEQNCEVHFRRICLHKPEDKLLQTDNFLNFYLGYDLISGYTGPFLDWRLVDPHVRRHADCRRAEVADESVPAPRPLLLLPHNVANFTYMDEPKLRPQFQLGIFENVHEAFLNLKKRKSIVIRSDTSYDADLKSITLVDGYKTNHGSGQDPYWIDEQEFWQENTPLIRMYLEKITGEFRLRSLDRLVMNPELIPDFANAIFRSNTSNNNTDENWQQFFKKYGTHFPIGGTVGGSIEILAKRKLCPKKNGTGPAHVVSMSEIGACLAAKSKNDPEIEKLQCGKLEKKFGVQSLSDAIDWTHRKVIGGEPTSLPAPDQFPGPEEVSNWSKSVQSNPRALSTNLIAVCELIEFIRKNDTDNSKIAKESCQRSLLTYVTEKDVLHVPNPAMIPCRKDAVAVWRFVEKKRILWGLPWCLSTANEEGSCPAPSTSTQAFRAALVRENGAANGGNGNKIKNEYMDIAMLFFGVMLTEIWW